MRFKLLTFAAALSLFNFTSAAQTSTAPPTARQQPAVNPPQDPSTQVPAPKPEDVKSTDSILAAVYGVISGPAGDRDWNRFRSLFLPGATLTSAGKDREGNIHVRPRSVEQYVTGAGGYFAQHGFFRQPCPDVWQHRPDPLQLRIPERRRGSAYRPRHQQFSAGLRW